LSWKEVAVQFQVSWHNVFESVQYVVHYGLKHRDLNNIRAIGIDEIQYQKGHKYLTLVYQIDTHCRRLLFVGKDRSVKTLLRFFYRFGKERTEQFEVICSDLWKAYLKVIKRKAKNVKHILDRFHVMKYLNDAVDKTRRQETAQLKHDGYEPVMENSSIVGSRINAIKVDFNCPGLESCCNIICEQFAVIYTKKNFKDFGLTKLDGAPNVFLMPGRPEPCVPSCLNSKKLSKVYVSIKSSY
jgi:hypothetical protein